MATDTSDLWNLVYLGIADWLLLLTIFFVMPVMVRAWRNKR